jgi:hypothetical protein
MSALEKETSPGEGEGPPRAAAAASSGPDAAVAAAAAPPDPASDAGVEDPEKPALDAEPALADVAVEKPPLPPAEEPVSAERSLDEKTTTTTGGDAVPTAAAAVVVAPQVEGEGGEKDKALADGEAEDESQYLVGLPRLLLGLGLCVTTFLIGLDQVRRTSECRCRG